MRIFLFLTLSLLVWGCSTVEVTKEVIKVTNTVTNKVKGTVSEKEEKKENIAQESLAKKLSNVEITIEVNVGEEEKMFGSITNLDIHKELTAKGFELEKSQIVIEEPIKALGIYHAKVKVAKDIISDVKLYVIKG